MPWSNGRSTADPVTSEHWSRGGYPGHMGIDTINHDEDWNWSVMGGVVIFAGWNSSGAGNEVRWRVNCSHGCIARVLHGATGTFGVSNGQAVGSRQKLIRTGNTGDSTGKHCHTEFWYAGNSNNRMEPREWMRLHGAASGSAGGGIDIIPTIPGLPTPTTKDSDMYMRRATDGAMWLVTPFGTARLMHPTHVGYFQRMFSFHPNWDDMLQAEIDIIKNYVLSAQAEFWSTLDGRLNAIRNQIATSIAAIPKFDVAPVVAAVTAALKGVKVDIDPTLIANATKAALKVNFDAIAAEQKRLGDEVSAALLQVGEIDQNTVKDAMILALQSQGVKLTEQAQKALVDAVEAELKDNVYQLTFAGEKAA